LERSACVVWKKIVNKRVGREKMMKKIGLKMCCYIIWVVFDEDEKGIEADEDNKKLICDF
jgi:hypothetical protein